MNNNYNKYQKIYKENNNKYIGAQSYTDIIRKLQRKKESEKTEINIIIKYINSLNKTDYRQLENICRQLLNANYKTSTPQQIIDLLKDAIYIQKQYKTPTKTTPKQVQSNNQTNQSAPKTSLSNNQATKTKPIIRTLFNLLKVKLQITAIKQKQTPPKAKTTTMPKPTMAILDTKNKWSPISLTGKIYDFNRGVIGIDKNGQKHKIILDGTNLHHNDATGEIGIRTNCTIKNRNAGPFEIAIEIANQGVTIIQLEGNSMLIYLPDEMTHKQLESLKTETAPRKNFKLSFTYKDYIYDNVNTDDLYTMCHNILPKEKVLTKAS